MSMKPHEQAKQTTTITVDRKVSDQIGELVGRCGKTKGDVVAAGLKALEEKLEVAA